MRLRKLINKIGAPELILALGVFIALLVWWCDVHRDEMFAETISAFGDKENNEVTEITLEIHSSKLPTLPNTESIVLNDKGKIHSFFSVAEKFTHYDFPRSRDISAEINIILASMNIKIDCHVESADTSQMNCYLLGRSGDGELLNYGTFQSSALLAWVIETVELRAKQ